MAEAKIKAAQAQRQPAGHVSAQPSAQEQSFRGTESEKRGAVRQMTAICVIPVYRLTKTGQRGKRQAGTVELVSDGWMIRAEYRPGGKAILPEGLLAGCVWESEGKKGNSEILSAVRRDLQEANRAAVEQGFALGVETVDQVMRYMDIKGLMRQLRRDNA